FPRGAQHNVSRFRIKPKVEFVPWHVIKLWFAGLGIEACSHEDQIFRELRKFRIDGDSESEIRHGATFVNRDLVWKFAYHAKQKRGGIFAGSFSRGPAFGQRTQLLRWMISTRGPSANPRDEAVALLP